MYICKTDTETVVYVTQICCFYIVVLVRFLTVSTSVTGFVGVAHP